MCVLVLDLGDLIDDLERDLPDGLDALLPPITRGGLDAGGLHEEPSRRGGLELEGEGLFGRGVDVGDERGADDVVCCPSVEL